MWAALSPKFRGLTFDGSSPFHKKTGAIGFRALKNYFGLSCDTEDYLFNEDTYPLGLRGKKSVINRIRALVKNNGDYTLHIYS